MQTEGERTHGLAITLSRGPGDGKSFLHQERWDANKFLNHPQLVLPQIDSEEASEVLQKRPMRTGYKEVFWVSIFSEL